MHNHTHHRAQQATKATLYGALKNIVLGALKVILGITGHSPALTADGIHSFSDLLTDILVLFASHWGSQVADTNHPYGHQRIETAASMFLAFFLMLTGLAIGYHAAFIHGIHEKPQMYVLIVALASVLLNEGLFQYTHYTAKKIQSNLLLANAWHHRSDAASSIVVLIGVAGATMGVYWLDSLAACIVGLMIIRMGGQLAWQSICELVDTGVESKVLERITQCIMQTPGVRAIHQLRTRSMGSAIFVDVHVLVDPHLSVSEGHYIAEKVHQRLEQSIQNVKDVTVHVDSEDDTMHFNSLDLPSREALFEQLKAESDFPWERYSSQIVLHYVQGQMHMAIYLDEDELIAIPIIHYKIKITVYKKIQHETNNLIA